MYFYSYYLLTPMSFQSCITFFLLWNSNGGVLKNVHAALFHIMKVDGDCEA